MLSVLLLAGVASSPTALPERWTTDSFSCPEGASLRSDLAASPPARWCERLDDRGETVRHGPYVELFPDGSVRRQGHYVDGVQQGRWITWSRAGEVVRSHEIWKGEGAGAIADPDGICPQGTVRDRGYGYDSEQQERMWSRCLVPSEDGEDGEEGKPVREGPALTYAVDRTSGSPVFQLVELTEYRRGKRTGQHLEWNEDGALVLEETLVEGRVDGERRELYLDGSLRQVSTYREGSLDGLRVAWYPDGQERWRASYEKGRLLGVDGDTTVADQPCPDDTLPVTSADGLEEWCERRTGGWGGTRHGAYVVWGEDGSIVERGLYRQGDKHQVWEAAPGTGLPVAVPDDHLVAEGRLWVGATPLGAKSSAEPRFWVRDLASHEILTRDVEVEGSRVRIFGLEPGSYYLGAVLDADADTPERYPGDFTAGGRFEVEAGEIGDFDLRFEEVLRLVEPYDNASPVPGWGAPCERKPFLPGPDVRFAWRGLGAGVEYRYEVHRLSCDPFQTLETVAEGSTPAGAVTVGPLPPLPRGQIYSFRLRAIRGDHTVGKLLTHGAGGGHGWDVRFRIAP